jgi:hypothetical protein
MIQAEILDSVPNLMHFSIMKIATQRATINVKPDSPSIYIIRDNLEQVIEISKDNVELYMEKLPPKLVVNQSGFDVKSVLHRFKKPFRILFASLTISLALFGEHDFTIIPAQASENASSEIFVSQYNPPRRMRMRRRRRRRAPNPSYYNPQPMRDDYYRRPSLPSCSNGAYSACNLPPSS